MERKFSFKRETAETKITLELNLDGTGIYNIQTGLKFIDHMLSLLTKHSRIDLDLEASGDLVHHLVEDIGISLGQSIANALGNKRGIQRYGYSLIPMDESLARCAIDFSGRKAINIDLMLNQCDIEDIKVEDLYHFFNSFAENAKMNLHLSVLYGEDQHHKAEAAFKALAKAIYDAKKIISDDIPSTKNRI
jgi:imidazoleglycerol-phosphate dehydratase